MSEPIYARREPAQGDDAKGTDWQDVVLYSDPECTKRVAIVPAGQTQPTRHQKFVFLNCSKRTLSWMET